MLPGADVVPWHSVNLLAVHPESRIRGRVEAIVSTGLF
jgi:hypothetical protein